MKIIIQENIQIKFYRTIFEQQRTTKDIKKTQKNEKQSAKV